uniref:(California timema) hypothetical protein n=1 Tax=Timema californicum TaxID=61474 RepID=A0A7R9JBJ0_TIMCA|nr:unnamed protein product [Timema californicum]
MLSSTTEDGEIEVIMARPHPLLLALMTQEEAKARRPPPGAPTLWRETGLWLAKRSSITPAVSKLTDARDLKPEDVRTLIGKPIMPPGVIEGRKGWGLSKCKIRKSLFDGALMEAELALAQKPSEINASHCKAVALYEMGEFEDALIHFHRGDKKRKKPDIFEVGIQQTEETIEDCIGRNVGPVMADFYPITEETIEDCIGRNVGPVMADFYPIIKEMEDKRKLSLNKLKDASDHERLSKKKGQGSLNKMSKMYLGGLHEDKVFLESFQKNPAIQSVNKKGAARILKLASTASDMLKQRQETLRTRRPLYALEYRAATLSTKMKAKKRQEKQAKVELIRSRAKKYVYQLEEIAAKRNLKTFIDAIEMAIDNIEPWSANCLPNKKMYLDTIYNTVASFYMGQKTFNYDRMKVDEKTRVVRLYLDLPVTGNSALDIAFNLYNNVFRDYRKILKKIATQVKETSDPNKLTYLYHEMGYYYSILGKHEIARSMAKKSLSWAVETNNLEWKINALVLVAKSELKQGNKTEAKDAIIEAQQLATELDDEEVVEFLMKCFDILDKLDTEEEPIYSTGKEEEIIRLITDERLKVKAQDLFRRTRTLPVELYTTNAFVNYATEVDPSPTPPACPGDDWRGGVTCLVYPLLNTPT